MNDKIIRVLHLPSTVGGNPHSISQHLNLMGFKSESWSLRGNYLNYPSDKFICSSKDGFFLQEIKKLWALRYIFFYDVIFFNFGRTLFKPVASAPKAMNPSLGKMLLFLYSSYSSLMQKIELLFLKYLKKIVLIQYQGDDARQGDYCVSHFAISIATQVDSNYYTKASDSLKREQIEFISRYCNKIYALNPDLLHVLPERAEFLPYSNISLSEWSPVYTQLEDRPLRIGHAPSHRGVKGTDLIIAAVDRLQVAGYKFEFVLIEGLSNLEAKERYKSIDVVVDQLFAGWYGGFAVECMALGKPVLAYIREDDLVFIPEQMREDLPIINVSPDTIEQGLMQILEMSHEELYRLAKRCRDYVEKWHDPITIAQRIKHDIVEAIGQTDL